MPGALMMSRSLARIGVHDSATLGSPDRSCDRRESVASRLTAVTTVARGCLPLPLPSRRSPVSARQPIYRRRRRTL